MTTRKIIIEHGDKEYIGEANVIENVSLGYQDHGILTFGLTCKGKGTGVVVGNMSLDTPAKHASEATPDLGRGEYGRYGTAYGLDALIAVMETVGVHRWEDLKGKNVLVLFEKKGNSTSTWGSMACGIANVIDEDKVLVFREHAEAWLDAEKDGNGL